MSDAPERIWAQDAEPSECHFIGGGWWDDDIGSHQPPHTVEYIRKDISDARIAELEVERNVTMREALNLATALHRRYYADVTQWEPLDYPAGIISQIDNMVAGLGGRTSELEAERDRQYDQNCEQIIRIAELEAALTEIANFTQTKNLLWWQKIARAALKGESE